MDPSPLVRTSFWTVLFGLTTTWVSNLGVNQGCVQRFLAVPNIKLAKRSVWIFLFGLIFIKGCSCLTGLLIYAKYETCDPVTTKVVNKLDQILPYFVMDVAGKIPGLPGLFIAGIFSAALSTMSSNLNTLAGTIYEDFLRNRFPNASEQSASNTMKILVIIIGFIELSLVFAVEHLGSIFTMTLALTGLTAGTLLGMFTIGMISRKANTKGVISGAIASMVIVGFILIGAHIYSKPVHLPYRIDGCDADLFNVTTYNESIKVPDIDVSETPAIFRISVMYFTLIGNIVVFIVAYPVSLLTGGGSNEIDEILLTPYFRSKNYTSKCVVVNDKKDKVIYSKINQTPSATKLIE